MGTKLGYTIAMLAGLATILGWLERSQWLRAFPGWIHQIVSQPWFLSTAFALMLLALVGTGLWKLRILDKRQVTLEQRVTRLEEWKVQGGGDTFEAVAERVFKQSIDPKSGGMDVKP